MNSENLENNSKEIESPQMSEVSTLFNIFIEPGKTFEDLRRKPRFILATIIIALLITGWGLGLRQKLGEENIRRQTAQVLEKASPQFESASDEQKEGAIDLQVRIGNIMSYVFPLLILLGLAIGGLLYWLGSKLFSGESGYLHGLSVFVYSSLPPTVVAYLASFLVLLFKSSDDLNMVADQRGLVRANPTMFIDGKETPILTTLISTVDLFAIWGIVLAAIGLRIVGKLSSGSAWAVVLILTLVGIAFRVIGSFFSGVPG